MFPVSIAYVPTPDPPADILPDVVTVVYRCEWLGICDTDNVVEPTLPESVWLCDPLLPTVPETSGHNLQPLVCRGSDADHIMPGIVRRKMVSVS